MNQKRLRLFSPLAPADCAARLASAIDSEQWSFGLRANTSPDKPIIGSLDGSSLRLCKRIDYRNSFQTSLSAEMYAQGTGTVIVGKFAMHPFVQVFMFVWFGGVVLFGGLGFLATAASYLPGSTTRIHGDPLMGVIIPPLMLVFGTCLVVFGRLLAKKEAQFITEFLIEILDAVPD